MTAITSTKFINGAFARLIALVLAGAIAFLLYSKWGPEIVAAFQGEPAPNAVVKAPASEANPNLQACLVRRVGNVDAMKSDGILSPAQYLSFKARAEDLCRAQNPPQ